MSILFRRSFKTAILSRFLKVTIATSNFMNKVYNGRFATESSISILKKTISLVWDYVYETRKQKAKLAEKYIWKQNMKSFSTETLNFSFRKFLASYVFDLAKIMWTLLILSQKSSWNFRMKEFWALENHVPVNMLLWSSHFTEVH